MSFFSRSVLKAPTALQVHPLTSSSVLTSWQPPLADSRIILGFKLIYKRTRSNGQQVARINSSFDLLKGAIYHKVQQLDGNTEYQFQVLAYNSGGDGVKSSPQFVTTPEGGK